MKTVVASVLFAVMMSSCLNNHYCPTYGNTKARSSSQFSAKKSKVKSDRTPYYKTARAEQD